MGTLIGLPPTAIKMFFVCITLRSQHLPVINQQQAVAVCCSVQGHVHVESAAAACQAYRVAVAGNFNAVLPGDLAPALNELDAIALELLLVCAAEPVQLFVFPLHHEAPVQLWLASEMPPGPGIVVDVDIH